MFEGKKSKYIFFVVLTLVFSVSASLIFNSQYNEGVDLSISDSVTVDFEPSNSTLDAGDSSLSLSDQTATTDIYETASGDLKLVIGERKYYNHSSGKYQAVNWSDLTEFTTDGDKLTISWLDKSVELELYTVDKSNKKEFQKEKKSTDKDALKLENKITKLTDKSYRFDHYMDEKEAEKLQKFGYKFSEKNTNCEWDGSDLVCEEQRISFKQAMEIQDFNVEYNKATKEIEISTKNENQSLKHIDPTLTINSNTNVCGEETGYTDVVITNGATVTICDYAGGDNGYWSVQGLTTFDMDAGTTINGAEKGYRKSTTTAGSGEGYCVEAGGHGGTDSSRGGGGGANGGNGGEGDYMDASNGEAGVSCDGNPYLIYMGGGGACAQSTAYYGGDGGGLIIINATGAVDIDGTIDLDGGVGYYYGGGGAGGGIHVIAGALGGSGTITADGGLGGNQNDGGGGGGGGRMLFEFSTDSSSFTLSAGGGQEGGGTDSTDGGGGSWIFVDTDISSDGIITIENNNHDTFHRRDPESSVTWIKAGSFTGMIIEDGSDVEIDGHDLVVDGDLELRNDNYYFDIETDSSINVTGTFTIYDDFLDDGTSSHYGNLIVGTNGDYEQSHNHYVYVEDTTTIIGNYHHVDASAGSNNGFVMIHSGDLNLSSAGTINVDEEGWIASTTTGGQGEGCGGGHGGVGSSTGGGGGAYGGDGGEGDYASSSEGERGSSENCGSVHNVTDMGSGGGSGQSTAYYGGDGGGHVRLNVTGTLTLDGSITTDGGDGYYYGGGGSGGGVWLIADAFAGSGTITSDGGDGGNQNDGGGAGSGGKIKIEYSTLTYSGSYSAHGGAELGTSTCTDGSGGTILLIDTDLYTSDVGGVLTIENNDNDVVEQNYEGYTRLDHDEEFTDILVKDGVNLLIDANINVTNNFTFNSDNHDLDIVSGAKLDVGELYLYDSAYDNSGDTVFTNLSIENAGVWVMQTTTELTIEDTLTIKSGGELNHNTLGGCGTDGLVKIHAPFIDIQSGGTIDVDHHGESGGYNGNTNTHGCGLGKGTGTTSTSYGGAGAGYAGFGGKGDGLAQSAGYGEQYGSAKNVTSVGSGGGKTNTNMWGGNGGGYVFLNVTDTLTLDGTITADGENGYNYGLGSDGAGGGSGGGIWLITDTLTGSGSITVNGGHGGGTTSDCGGGASGGRIKLEYNSYDDGLTLEAFSGQERDTSSPACESGGVGTIFLHDLDSQDNGDLYLIDDTAISYYDHMQTWIEESTQIFDNIYISSDASIVFDNILNVTEDLDVADDNFLVEFDDGSTIHITDFYLNDSLVDDGTTHIYNNLTVESNGDYQHSTLNTVIVDNHYDIYGNVDHADTSDGTNNGDVLIQANTMTIHSGGTINLDSHGYAGGYNANTATHGYGVFNGGGMGTTSTSYGGAGAGHAGEGGDGDGLANDATHGKAYGSATNVTQKGSGGGKTGSTMWGGDGGGYVFLNVTDTLTMDGTIDTDAENGYNYGVSADGAGGGSGGGIWLFAGTIAGSGTLTANGGHGGGTTSDCGGGGSGGRILVEFTDSSSQSFTTTANAGIVGDLSSPVCTDGAEGTVVIQYGGEDYYEVNWANGSTENPMSVEGGENVLLTFSVDHNTYNLTDNSTDPVGDPDILINITECTIGGEDCQIANRTDSQDASQTELSWAGFESDSTNPYDGWTATTAVRSYSSTYDSCKDDGTCNADGVYSIQISGTSDELYRDYDLSDYDGVNITFSYHGYAMDTGDCMAITIDGDTLATFGDTGSSCDYTVGDGTKKRYSISFNDGDYGDAFSGGATTIQFKDQEQGSYDYVYIDGIQILGVTNAYEVEVPDVTYNHATGLWEVNVTIPEGLAGDQDGFINMTTTNAQVWSTETGAFAYPAGFDAYSANVNESVSVSDSQGRTGWATRVNPETVSLSPDTDRKWDLTRIFGEGISFSSITSRLSGFFRLSTVTTTFEDVVDRLTHFFRFPAETLGISDILSRMAFLGIGISQSFTVTDSANRKWLHTEGISQGFSMTDNVGRALEATRNSAQGVGVGAGLDRMWYLWKTFDEEITADPSADRLAEIMRDPNAGVVLTTATNRLYVGLKTIDNALDFSTVTGRLLDAGRGISESVSITTITDRAWTLTRIFGESFTIDVLTERSTGIFRNPIVEVSVSDSVGRLGNFFRNILQEIVFVLVGEADYEQTLQELFVNVGEDITVSPLAQVLASMFRDLNQGISFGDATGRLAEMFKRLGETISFTDGSGKSFFGIRTTEESITIISVTDRMGEMWTIISQTISLDDVINKVFAGNRGIGESISFSSVGDRSLNAFRSITAVFSISDNVAISTIKLYLRDPSLIINFNLVTDRLVEAQRSITGILGFDDFIGRVYFGDRGIDDTVTIDDNSGRYFAGFRGVSDSATFNLIVDRLINVERGISQLFSLDPTTGRLWFLQQGVDDSISVGDDSGRLFEGTRSSGASISLSDISSRAINIIRAPMETISVDLLVDRFLKAQRSLSDLLGIDPATNRIWFLTNDVGDTIGISESSGRLFHAFRVSDISFSISDVTSRIQYVWRVISETLGIAEDIEEPSGLSFYFVTITDSISVDNVASRVQYLWKYFSDSFSITEDEGKSFGTSRNVNVAVSINEAIDRTSSFVRSIWDVITWIIGIGGESETPDGGATPLTPTGAGSPQPKEGEIKITEELDDHMKLERAMLWLKIMLWSTISLLMLLIILATDIARRNEKMGLLAQLGVIFIGLIIFITLGIFTQGYITDHVTPDNGYHGMVYAGCWALGIVILALVTMASDVMRRKKVISGWNQAMVCVFTAVVLFFVCWCGKDWMLGMSLILNIWVLGLLIGALVIVIIAFLIDMIRHF